MSTAPEIDLDEDTADEFTLDEVVFPYAPPQQWVLLCPQLTADEIGVYAFLMTHLNPYTGKFEAFPARTRIADRFDKSLDWVDKRLKALIGVGAMSKRAMYWLDMYDHDKGRTPADTDEHGAKRSQAPNKYTVRLRPHGQKPDRAALYEGPIKIGEFYHPDRIGKRVTDNGGNPSAELLARIARHKEANWPSRKRKTRRGGDATQRPGGDDAQRPGGDATQRPKRTRVGKDHGDGKTTGAADTEEPSLRSGSSVSSGSACVDHDAGDQTAWGGESPPARVRNAVGDAACQAFHANPSMSETELVDIITSNNPALSREYAALYAMSLIKTAPDPGSGGPGAPHEHENPIPAPS